MSAFSFFFSFYGLLLGLCVAELVGGLARTLHERKRVHFGWLTPALALFVAIDIATFWNQAWIFFRGAPYNMFLLLLGLVIASTFYIAASITFPKLSQAETQHIDLDQHFWEQRRTIFSCILAANLIVVTLILCLASANAEFARVASSARLWIGLAIFVAGTATAGFAKNRLVAKIALICVLAYSLWGVWNSLSMLITAGGWAPAFTVE